jgi:poly(A) polymerase/tRNA nucleotidyltransferase (CCA-adding enzyme)
MKPIEIPKEVRAAVAILHHAGFEAYLVGGCARDLLINRAPKDWDITTNARPEKIQELFPDSFYENKFGTVSVITRSEDPTLRAIEITPYRIEGKYSDKRHPDEVTFADKLEDDLSRRDFTMNAIALDIREEPFATIDPFGGAGDIEKKLIRAVGDAKKRFEEDALRIMRAVRFAAELRFIIEPTTAAALTTCADLLSEIAIERIRDEFIKIIMTAKPSDGLNLIREFGILKKFMPELEEGWGCGQNKHHIYTVWEHNLRACDYAAEERWSFDVRLSALFHDIGKPRSKHGDGPDSTFYNHEVIGAKMAHTILSRMRFSTEVVDKVEKMVRFHLFYYNVDEVTESSVRRLVQKVGVEDMEDLIRVRMCDRIGSGVPKAEPYKLRHFRFLVEKVQRDPVSVGMLAIDGNRIKELAKVEQGPMIGFILHALLEDVLDDPGKNTVEYLEKRVGELSALPETELKALAESGKNKKAGLEEEELSRIKKRHWVK